ncbi:hypothetical protein AMELA_G00050030 [Ameiurus melas]|uniref:Uncharacterized protein n=1 Tax=Ameiurus melas TaxID=219545 RepID=A0A7J6B584_AMEME|nr:hypothetical protein AMELA_G00050030 [Ameiurus melas]
MQQKQHQPQPNHRHHQHHQQTTPTTPNWCPTLDMIVSSSQSFLLLIMEALQND